jgi:hypothetical protein
LLSAGGDALQPAELRGKWIALVLQVEFDPFRGEYGCASPWAAFPLCKGQCRALKQKQPAGPSFGVACNPEAVVPHAAVSGQCRRVYQQEDLVLHGIQQSPSRRSSTDQSHHSRPRFSAFAADAEQNDVLAGGQGLLGQMDLHLDFLDLHGGGALDGGLDLLYFGVVNLSKIDRWFLTQIKEIVDFEEELAAAKN